MSATVLDAPTHNQIDALNRVKDIAASQNGHITRAQAARVGVSDVALHRLVKNELVAKADSGIYVLPGAPELLLGEVYVAWLRFNPDVMPLDRIAKPFAVTTGATAAHVWDAGVLQEHPFEFAVAKPYRTHRVYPQLHLTVGLPAPRDITIHKGIAVTTPEATVEHLLVTHRDWDHVGRVLRDFIAAGRTTMTATGKRLNRIAPAEFRNGRAWAEHLIALAVF